jgi:serine/threonine protein kinase
LIIINYADSSLASHLRIFDTIKHSSLIVRNHRAGTSVYFAPERGHGRVYGRKADMWAAGCCVVELLVGAPLTGPIYHEGDEVSRKREALLHAAEARCPHRRDSDVTGDTDMTRDPHGRDRDT